MKNLILYTFSAFLLLYTSGCSDRTMLLSNEKDIHMENNKMNKDMIIGDLGGVPVEIPKNVIRLVEYDGDPGWGEQREGKVPERTYQSKINSFGFDVRYTDGALYDGIVGKFADEYEAQKNLPNSPWVSVGIMSGNRYHGEGAVHRIGNGRIKTSPNELPVHTYAKLENLQYGLEVYAHPGIDPKTNKPWREDDYAEDVFVQRDSNGMITTYIECTNRDVRKPPCTLYFDLEPEMGLYAYVSFSRHTLADWPLIQQVVTKTILGFKKH